VSNEDQNRWRDARAAQTSGFSNHCFSVRPGFPSADLGTLRALGYDGGTSVGLADSTMSARSLASRIRS
jgi:hypothetical protein